MQRLLYCQYERGAAQNPKAFSFQFCLRSLFVKRNNRCFKRKHKAHRMAHVHHTTHDTTHNQHNTQKNTQHLRHKTHKLAHTQQATRNTQGTTDNTGLTARAQSKQMCFHFELRLRLWIELNKKRSAHKGKYSTQGATLHEFPFELQFLCL